MGAGQARSLGGAKDLRELAALGGQLAERFVAETPARGQILEPIDTFVALLERQSNLSDELRVRACNAGRAIVRRRGSSGARQLRRCVATGNVPEQSVSEFGNFYRLFLGAIS